MFHLFTDSCNHSQQQIAVRLALGKGFAASSLPSLGMPARTRQLKPGSASTTASPTSPAPNTATGVCGCKQLFSVGNGYLASERAHPSGSICKWAYRHVGRERSNRPSGTQPSNGKCRPHARGQPVADGEHRTENGRAGVKKAVVVNFGHKTPVEDLGRGSSWLPGRWIKIPSRSSRSRHRWQPSICGVRQRQVNRIPRS